MGLGMIKKNEKEHKSYDEYLDKKKEISNAEEYLEDPQPSQSSGSSESRRGESVGHDLSHKNKSVRIFDATPSQRIERQFPEEEKEGVKDEALEIYQQGLVYHIIELDDAKKDPNPARFKLAFNAFKVFVVNNWS